MTQQYLLWDFLGLLGTSYKLSGESWKLTGTLGCQWGQLDEPMCATSSSRSKGSLSLQLESWTRRVKWDTGTSCPEMLQLPNSEPSTAAGEQMESLFNGGWKVETPVMVKVRSWWLLSQGEQTPAPPADLQAIRGGSGLRQLPGWELCAGSVRERAEPEPCGKRKQRVECWDILYLWRLPWVLSLILLVRRRRVWRGLEGSDGSTVEIADHNQPDQTEQKQLCQESG